MSGGGLKRAIADPFGVYALKGFAERFLYSVRSEDRASCLPRHVLVTYRGCFCTYSCLFFLFVPAAIT